MPYLEMQITCSFRGASRVEMERTISVEEKTLEHLFPEITSGQGVGWPHAHKAEAVSLVCAVLRDAFFADEVTTIDTLEDLKRLGTDYLHVNFRSGRSSASVPLIG